MATYLKIEAYYASNKHGTAVHLSAVDLDNPDPGVPNESQLMQMFHKSKDSLCDYTYPNIVDFQ
jgi:hypothetical protein